MNCMKCGREIPEEEVFCRDCLQEMEKYPVPAGAAVMIPKRRESTIQKKTPKRHVPSPEEQIRNLRKWVMILTLLLTLCVAIIVIMLKPTISYITEDHFAIGQNYSSVVSTAPPQAE